MLSNTIKTTALVGVLFSLPSHVCAGLIPSQDSTDYEKIGYTGHNTDLIPADFFRVTVSRVYPRGDKVEPDPQGVRISIDRQQPGPLAKDMQLDNLQVLLEHEDRDWHKIQAPFLPYELGVKVGHAMWKMDKMSYKAAGDGLVLHYADVHADVKRDARCHIGGGYKDDAESRCRWRPKWGCGRIWHCDLPALGEHPGAAQRRNVSSTGKYRVILPSRSLSDNGTKRAPIRLISHASMINNTTTRLVSRSFLVNDTKVEPLRLPSRSSTIDNTETLPSRLPTRSRLINGTDVVLDRLVSRSPMIDDTDTTSTKLISRSSTIKDADATPNKLVSHSSLTNNTPTTLEARRVPDPEWRKTNWGFTWPDVQGAWEALWAPISSEFQYKKARDIQARKIVCHCKGHRKCGCVEDGQPPSGNGAWLFKWAKPEDE